MRYRASLMIEIIVHIVDGEIADIEPVDGYGSTYVEVVDLDAETERDATEDEEVEALGLLSGRWAVSSLPR